MIKYADKHSKYMVRLVALLSPMADEEIETYARINIHLIKSRLGARPTAQDDIALRGALEDLGFIELPEEPGIYLAHKQTIINQLWAED